MCHKTKRAWILSNELRPLFVPQSLSRIMGGMVLGILVAGLLHSICAAAPDSASASPYAQWKNGPSSDPSFFPIAVWLQSPANAERYKAAGINLYVALWRGPTAEQLATLQKAGMRVICGQNRQGLANKDNPTIVGWMHGDEPDNAQSLGSGKGYGPPIPPESIIRDYERMRVADPTRPIMLNLGQGVAWDRWYGRGVRTNHPEDYTEYVKGGDIISFDIYPVVHDNAEVVGKLEFVPRGVERLVEWTGGTKLVWNCIECTHISNAKVKPTPQQVRSEVWMALIQGSRGLIYFVHQFQPSFKEAALLDDPGLLKAVTDINLQIAELAPVLNSPTVVGVGQASSSNAQSPIGLMVKKYQGSTYLFAAAKANQASRGTLKVSGLADDASIEVLGEVRTLKARAGEFSDDFQPYGVHLYRCKEATAKP